MNKVPTVMSNAELENEQIILRKDLIDIRTQIEEYNLTKKYLHETELQDEDWLRKATYSLRIKGHQHNLVLKEIGLRNRKSKENNRKFSDYFLSVAESCMDKTMFDDLKNKAKKMCDEYHSSNPTEGIIKVDY